MPQRYKKQPKVAVFEAVRDFTIAIGRSFMPSQGSGVSQLFMKTQVAHSTIEHLMQVLPGQSVDWYIRVGQQIHEGKMPMPSLDGQAPPLEKVSMPDRRLKNLLALCDDSKPKLNAVIEYSCRKHPDKPMDWHLDQIEAMLRPTQLVETYRSRPKQPTTSRPAPEHPMNMVSEEVKANAKLAEENDKEMEEKVKLYSNFGFYS